MQSSFARSWSEPWRRGLAGICLLLVLLTHMQVMAQSRRHRLAVVVLAERTEDAQLAEGLTELVIATAAEQQPAVLVGTDEFVRELGLSLPAAALCLERSDCRRRALETARLQRLLWGTLARRDGGFVMELSLCDENGAVQRQSLREATGGVDALLDSVRRTTQQLLANMVSTLRVQTPSQGTRLYVDGTPRPAGGSLLLKPGTHAIRVVAEGHLPWHRRVQLEPGQTLSLQVRDGELVRRRRWPATVAYGAAAGSVATLATGMWMGREARRMAVGTSRQVAQADFERRRDLGRRAEACFIASALLAGTAAVTFTLFRNHIFPDQ